MQAGLSLVELMVGLTIGLVLTLGMFTLIASTSQSFRVSDDFSRMQENATSAFRYLGDSLRQAGFYGYGTDPATIAVAAGSAVSTVTDCGSGNAVAPQPANTPAANWALQVTTPIFAYFGLTPLNVNTIFPCILAANFNAGPPIANANPILVTRGANGYRICNVVPIPAPGPPVCINAAAKLDQQPNYLGTIYVQSDPANGIIFYGSEFAALLGAGTTRKFSNGNDVDIFEYRAHVYYIRPCSRPVGGAANCTGAGDDGGQPIPTLVRQELIGNVMTEVPLVEGIDLIDYRFGVDSDGDGVPDTFKSTPVANDWPNVVAVKVTLLVRSPTLNLEYNDGSKQYDLNGDGLPDYVCTALPAPACNYKRKVFSQTIQVRNIAQRKGA